MHTDTYRFLAFDCGATSGRAMLGTFSGDDFKMEEVYRFPNQMLELGGAYYWNVYAIYEHILRCLTELARKGVQLDSLGIDTWGVDFGLLAEDGTLLSLPRAYRDPYTMGMPERLFATVPREELYALTGIQTMDFNSIFQLYAQKENGVSALDHAKKLLFMPDLLSYFLTGKAVCEYTIASTSGMVNAFTRQFDKHLLNRLGLPTDLLLPLVQPGTVVGTLLPFIAKKTGIGEVPVVAVAGHDTASAVAAVMGAGSHDAYLSSGTWSLMGIVTNEPIVTARAAELNFTNEGGTEGTIRFLKNITGMWLLEQCRKAWNIAGRDYSYNEMTAMAEREKDYTGRINPDDPRFANPDDMDAEIRQALAEGGHPTPKNDAELLSCIYHSLADRYGEVMGMLRELAPFEIERLHIIGGGANNKLLNQWTEEAIGIPVVAGPTEATAMGNLRVQWKLKIKN
jgi:rhamnulokinase